MPITKLDMYNAAKERVNKAMAEAQAMMQEAFKEAAQALFQQHPELESFSWTQYTPYFNDGDTCEFGVHTDYGRINDIDMGEIYPMSSWGDKEYPAKNETLVAANNAVQEFLQLFAEKDMQTMFGDHAEITVNRDASINVDECDHD